MRKSQLLLLVFFCLFFALSQDSLCAASEIAKFLCEVGISYYKAGKYDDALGELEKVLMIEPDNPTAREYIELILSQEPQPQTVSLKKIVSEVSPPPEKKSLIISQALDKFSQFEQQELTISQMPAVAPAVSAQEAKKEELELKRETKVSGIRLSGEVQMRAGLVNGDAVWKRANWDLNEKNWRILSDAGFNQKENTYDPRIFDRLRLNLDTEKKEGFGFHTSLIIDPWSFTGKSNKMTLTGAGGDIAEIELKYWSNTGYALNEMIYTLKNGDSFVLPELKVKDGKISSVTVITAFGDIFTIPETKIHHDFQPLRELWVIYQQDWLNLKLFPFAYENQTLTFDDPLKLSNNRIWWEESPWLRRWKSGIYNSGALPVDFSKGYWDNSISFAVRDSEGSRLTQLRGFSLDIGTKEQTLFQGSLASPKDPWQDYSEVDNIISANRLTHRISDTLTLGVTTTARLGFNTSQNDKTDAKNFVGGTDIRAEVMEGVLVSLEVASSKSQYDLTSPGYETKKRGNAYYFSLMGRYPRENIINTEYGFGGINQEETEEFFAKWRIFGAHLDKGFDPSLSSYLETRDDEFWSRHIHFRRPTKYYYIGFYQDALIFDDVNAYAIGNGIDIGRDILGLRLENSAWGSRLKNLFDTRYVHSVDGKYLESVIRDELTWKSTDKLTFKGLGIYHDLPRTHAGTDPFIFNPQTGRYYDNIRILDGKDPSLKTGSVGLEYEFFDWLALNGIWEHTNDYYLGYDSFPAGILNDGNRSAIYTQNGKYYREIRNWLYGQEYFPQPPYPYYDIFKAGLRFNPMKKLELYFDYTRNEYEKAGQVDDNMNHLGMEAIYSFMDKLKMFLRYTYSRWQDLDRIVQGDTKCIGHHNFFSELMYRKSEDEDFVLQYGETGRTPIMGEMITIGSDPYSGSLRTIDTRHIFRLFYRRKF